jgi:hypothetical protein
LEIEELKIDIDPITTRNQTFHAFVLTPFKRKSDKLDARVSGANLS